jgi:hypothetical protein
LVTASHSPLLAASGSGNREVCMCLLDSILGAYAPTPRKQPVLFILLLTRSIL